VTYVLYYCFEMEGKEITTPKVNLVQPNKVTNARYEYTACQENVLTCMIESVQAHMTQQRPIQTDLFGHPTVRLKASDIAKGKSKYYVLQQLRELRKKDIDFEYKNDRGQIEDVTTGLISSFRNIRETDYIDLEISVWAIPYLLYWGKEVGGTIFSKTLALTLKGIYSKRLYKLCKRWEDRGGFAMQLDEFRHILALEKKYPRPALLTKNVLDPAKRELDEYGDVTFEYDLTKVKSRSYNHIAFKIIPSKMGNKEGKNEWYKLVYTFLCRTYPSYENNRAQLIADELSDTGQLRLACAKFQKLDDAFSKGSKNREDVIKLTKHILKQDFKLKIVK